MVRLMLIGMLLVAINHAVGAHAQVSIETQDGLKLSLGDSGNVAEVRIGEKALPLLEKPGGFFVTDVERSKRNLMPDGDFESGAGIKEQGWQLEGSWKIAEENGQHFAQAVLETTEGSGNIRSPMVQVESGTGYLVTARVRTTSGAGNFAPGFYIVQYDAHGQVVKTPTSGGEAVQIGMSIPRAAAKFTQVSTTFVTQPSTTALQVYANIYRSAGSFDLDEVRLEPIEAAPTSFQGKMQPTSKGAVFSGISKELSLILEATFTSYSDHIRVDGMVRDTTGEDRPLRVGFHLPVDALGWTWWDDIAESRQIEEGQRYGYYGTDWGVGRGRQVSVFPFASVTGDGAGLGGVVER